MASIDYMCDVGTAAPPKPVKQTRTVASVLVCFCIRLGHRVTDGVIFVPFVRPTVVPRTVGLLVCRKRVGAACESMLTGLG